MSFANADGNFETFFAPTRIWLFGKEFNSLIYDPTSMGKWKDASGVDKPGEFTETYQTPAGTTPLPMPPRRLERTLRKGLLVHDDGTIEPQGDMNRQRFARVYSFSYEGHYYRLPRPLLFLVSGEGQSVKSRRDKDDENEGQDSRPKRNKGAGNEPLEQLRGANRPNKFSATMTGVEARDWDFSDDILVWAVDRKDLTVCLDVEIGNYQEVLLDSMIASERSSGDDRGARSRGDIIGRGGAGSFRGDMIGPHQNKL